MNAVLEIKTSITKEDVTDLRRETYNYAAFVIKFIIAMWLILSCVQSISIKLLLIALALLYFVKWIFGVKRWMRNTVRGWADLGEMTYSVDDSGVSVAHSKGNRKFGWETLTTFAEYKSALIIYHLEQTAIFIPKRCLEKESSEKLSTFLHNSKNLTIKNEQRQKLSERITFGLAIFLLIFLVLIFASIPFIDNIINWIFTNNN